MSDTPTPHTLLNPDTLAPARGYTHAVVAAPGRVVAVAGQVAMDASGTVVGDTLVEQFDVALSNVAAALDAAGARPEHVVSMLVFVTAMDEYRAGVRDLGPVWRRHFGRHYPAMALVATPELVEPAAKVEIVTTAVVPG
ncbi:MAG TPA: RidA family protein [Acidimicrobiales bacterium]|jgi:enamine deaminase RidA (YjgF/YER057c/UK114 family)